MEQNILPGAVAKLDDVFLLQLVISLGLDPVVVQEGPVGGSQVNNIGQNPGEHNNKINGTLMPGWCKYIFFFRPDSI